MAGLETRYGFPNPAKSFLCPVTFLTFAIVSANAVAYHLSSYRIISLMVQDLSSSFTIEATIQRLLFFFFHLNH